MSVPDADDVQFAAPGVKEDVRQTMLRGVAITVPFFITLIVLAWAMDVVSNLMSPVVDLLTVLGPARGQSDLLVEIVSLLILLGLVFLAGLLARRGPDQPRVGERLDAFVSEIPALGSIYTGVDRLSEVLLESDTESFQDVVLVAFPHDESFVLGFLTADTPTAIEDAGGHEQMVTVFLPLAPNPVMGGHLVHVPEDRAYDVDMDVEEGMQAIMTTGAAVDQGLQEERA